MKNTTSLPNSPAAGIEPQPSTEQPLLLSSGGRRFDPRRRPQPPNHISLTNLHLLPFSRLTTVDTQFKHNNFQSSTARIRTHGPPCRRLSSSSLLQLANVPPRPPLSPSARAHANARAHLTLTLTLHAFSHEHLTSDASEFRNFSQ